MKKFDAIIIGAGQAGTPLAKKLAQAGLQTALIEKRQVGGTCINDGCTPTKSMIACAKMAYKAAQSENLGVNIQSYSVDLRKIISRKNQIVDRFRKSSVEGLEKTVGLTLLYGEAVFIDHKTLRVDMEDSEEVLTAEKIFLDTGLKPHIPELDGLNTVPYYTSTTLLDVEELPPSLLILGGSYIGLELGQMFRRFGSDVTIIERGQQLLPREDEDIASAVKEILEEEGIRILLDTRIKRIRSGKQIELDDGKQTITGTHLLLATGRIPQTTALHLEKTGVATDQKGYITVNEHLETSVPGIYALGDTKGGPAFTHISFNDYVLVAQNLLKGTNHSIADRQIPYCVFTDPQLGRVGMTEKEARGKGLEVEIASLPMNKTSRGIETGNTKGIMKAVVDRKSGKILGAAILGEEGGEVMSVMEMAMRGGFTAMQIMDHVFAHPLYSESLNNLFMTLEK